MDRDQSISPEEAAALQAQVYGEVERELVARLCVRVVDESELPEGEDLAMATSDDRELVILVARRFAEALAEEVVGTPVDAEEVQRIATDQVALMFMEATDSPVS